MPHKIVWKARDRERLERAFELYYGGTDHQAVAQSAVEKFIRHVTHRPIAWSVPDGKPYIDHWKCEAVTVWFRRYPETLVAEIVDIQVNPA